MTTTEINDLLEIERAKLPEVKAVRTPAALMKPKPVRGRTTKVLGTRIEVSLYAKAQRRAEQAGVSLSEYVEYLLLNDLDRKR